MSEPSRIKPENLEAWAADADRYWTEMLVDDRLPFNTLRQNWRHCLNKYGKCPAYDACHTLLRDESTMETLYNKKEKR